MKMMILMLTLYTFVAVAWEKVSKQNVVQDAMTTTVLNEDDYEGGAYAAPVTVEATRTPRLKEYIYENGAYDEPAIVKDPIPSRPTD